MKSGRIKRSTQEVGKKVRMKERSEEGECEEDAMDFLEVFVYIKMTIICLKGSCLAYLDPIRPFQESKSKTSFLPILVSHRITPVMRFMGVHLTSFTSACPEFANIVRRVGFRATSHFPIHTSWYRMLIENGMWR